jgi:SNF2 family DNA or RNA helicase
VKWKPEPYQDRIVKHILAHPAAAVWARVGSGKTSATLAALDVMRRKAKFRALVIAPKHVALNVWAQEAAKWDAFRHLKVNVLHGSKKSSLLRAPADIYVLNYDGLPWLARESARGWHSPEVLVLDESSKCRNTDTQRFKGLRDGFAPRFKRRIALSGTPMPNGEVNLFGQYRLLDGGERLGRYITHFRNKFCYPSGYGGYDWLLLPGAAEKVRELVQDITVEVSADDLGSSLAGLVVRDIEVPLPPSAEATYQKLERDFVARLRTGEVTAVNAAAQTQKLRQIASGSVYTTHPDWEPVHDARLEALDSLLEEASGPVLLFAEFSHEFERIKKAFPETVVFTELSDKRKQQCIIDWNAGKIPLLAAHPASAGHGLNLQGGGDTIVWFSLLYDLELYDQSNGRLQRKGQKSRQVFIHRFVSPGTIDGMMVRALAHKGADQESFLLALRQHYLGLGSAQRVA